MLGADIAPGGAEETLRLVEAGWRHYDPIHPADLTDKAECERVVATTVERFGGIDVLFNNGAMAYSRGSRT